MSKFAIILFLGILAILSFLHFNNSNSDKRQVVDTSSVITISPIKEKNKQVDYKASFAIFTNGTFRIFSDPKYHNQSEVVFLQDDNPNIIYVKKQGITWDDFFKTLPMELKKDCLITGTGQTFCTPLRQGSTGQAHLKFYINGNEDKDALEKVIGRGDKLLVTYGNENAEQIKEQLKKVPTAE